MECELSVSEFCGQLWSEWSDAGERAVADLFDALQVYRQKDEQVLWVIYKSDKSPACVEILSDLRHDLTLKLADLMAAYCDVMMYYPDQIVMSQWFAKEVIVRY